MMTRSTHAWRLAGLSALMAVMALASAPRPEAARIDTVVHPGQLEWKVAGSWRKGQGLPQDRVHTLHQSRDGYLWVGTRGGVARFDGLTFTTWNARDGSALPAGEVYAFAETADGTLWIAVNGGGLGRYRRGAFSTLTKADGLVDDLARALVVDDRGALWIGTERGLSRYVGGAFTSFGTRDGLADAAVRCLAADPAGHGILVGTGGGLQRLDNGRFTRVLLPSGRSTVQVDALVHDRAGRLWIGTSNGLFLASGDGVVEFGPREGLASSAIQGLMEDADGRLWVATSNGLGHSIGLPGAGMGFTTVLTGVDVTTVHQDSEGSVWAGFRGYGLVRLQRSLFRFWDRDGGLPSNTVTTVFQGSDGTVWAGSGASLAAIRRGGVVLFGVESGLPERAVSSLSEDGTGRLWVGTEAGLYRSERSIPAGGDIRSTRFSPVGRHHGLRTHVRVLCREDDGGMVVGTSAEGVVRVARDGKESVPDGASAGEVRALVCDGGDGLWVGTRGGGLARIQGSRVTRYSTAEGLPDDNVQSAFRDRDGVLWVATRKGLCRMKDGRLTSITTLQGLPDNHVYGMTEDGSARLWMASGSGVFAIRRADLNAVADGRLPTVPSEVFGLEHGLPSTLCALSHHPVAITTRDGHIWFATLGGVVEADPSTPRPVAPSPPVQLESVTINDEKLAAFAALDVPQGRGTLVFRYTAPSFIAAGDVEFRYRLEGSDPGWVLAGTSRDARYTNIPPGRYRFVVTARSRGSAWRDSSAGIDVTLRPHFYQSTFFRVFSGVAILSLVFGAAYTVHRARLRQIQARERELARRVDKALTDIKVLQGLLPICAWCKKIRDDHGYWTQMEAYIKEHSQAVFSHGMCPDCLRQHYPDDARAMEAQGDAPSRDNPS
jgi:ligand-binding sensor domain-containing protein